MEYDMGIITEIGIMNIFLYTAFVFLFRFVFKN